MAGLTLNQYLGQGSMSQPQGAPSGLSGIDLYRLGQNMGIPPYLLASAPAGGPGYGPVGRQPGPGPVPGSASLPSQGFALPPRSGMLPSAGMDMNQIAGPTPPGPNGYFPMEGPNAPPYLDPRAIAASMAMQDDPGLMSAPSVPGAPSAVAAQDPGMSSLSGVQPPYLKPTDQVGAAASSTPEAPADPGYQTQPYIQKLIEDLIGGGDPESDKWGALGQGFAKMAESPFFLQGLAQGAGLAMDKMEASKAESTKRKIAGAGLQQGETRAGEEYRAAREREAQGRTGLAFEGTKIEQQAARDREDMRKNRAAEAYDRGRLDLARASLTSPEIRLWEGLKARGVPDDVALNAAIGGKQAPFDYIDEAGKPSIGAYNPITGKIDRLGSGSLSTAGSQSSDIKTDTMLMDPSNPNAPKTLLDAYKIVRTTTSNPNSRVEGVVDVMKILTDQPGNQGRDVQDLRREAESMWDTLQSGARSPAAPPPPAQGGGAGVSPATAKHKAQMKNGSMIYSNDGESWWTDDGQQVQ